MLAAAEEKGYVEISVMDIVRHAKVSKRTFYEHFEDKERCFLATYTAISAELLGRVSRAALLGDTGEEKLERAIGAYIGALEEHQHLIRAFLSDVHAAGHGALGLRRTILLRFADLLRMVVDSESKTRADLRPLTPEMAMTIIGGVHELILLLVEQGRSNELRTAGQTAYEMITALLKVPEASVVELPVRRVRAR